MSTRYARSLPLTPPGHDPAGFSDRSALLPLAAFLLFGCQPHHPGPPAAADRPLQRKQPTTMKIRFSPGHLYEVSGLWLNPGADAALDTYFAAVAPIAMERYGMRPLLGLEPQSVYAGDFKPDRMFVNEWPSRDRFEAFLADPDVASRVADRDAALARIVVAHYSVPAASEVEVQEGDVVEFNAMWIRPGQEEALGEYYAGALPIAKRHGVQPITPLQPEFCYRGDFRPSRAALMLWGTHDRFQAFATELAPLTPRRDAALQRLEVVHAALRLGGES